MRPSEALARHRDEVLAIIAVRIQNGVRLLLSNDDGL